VPVLLVGGISQFSLPGQIQPIKKFATEPFVDGLDLAAAGFTRVAPKVTGRPSYAPTDLPKLYIYGYLNRVSTAKTTLHPAYASDARKNT
jgi:hypothetical protein